MGKKLYEEPDVSLFVPCPCCGRLLSEWPERCPHCRELIDDDQRVVGAVLTGIVTQAVSVANNLATFDVAILLCLGLTAYAYVSGFTVFALVFLKTGAIALYGCGRWLRRYGRLGSTDPDFVAANSRVRLSLAMWLAFMLFEGALTIWVVAGYVTASPR